MTTMPTANTVLSEEQAERIHREAHYGSMPSLADIDALCQTVRGLRRQVDGLMRAVKIRDTFLSGDEAAKGLQEVAAFLDIMFTGREGRQMTWQEMVDHIKEINSEYEDVMEKLAKLQSRLSAVEAERDGLRAELTEEKRLRAELKEIAQTGISEVGSVGATLKENAVIDFRSRAIALCRAKADEWERDASDPRADLKNLIGVRGRARADAARELATELEGLE